MHIHMQSGGERQSSGARELGGEEKDSTRKKEGCRAGTPTDFKGRGAQDCKTKPDKNDSWPGGIDAIDSKQHEAGEKRAATAKHALACTGMCGGCRKDRKTFKFLGKCSEDTRPPHPPRL